MYRVLLVRGDDVNENTQSWWTWREQLVLGSRDVEVSVSMSGQRGEDGLRQSCVVEYHMPRRLTSRPDAALAEGDLCDSCEPWPLDSFLPRRGCCARTSSFRSRGSHASNLLAKSRRRRRKVSSRYSGLSFGFVVDYRSRELCESFKTTFIL